MDTKNKSIIRRILIGLTVMASSFCIASAGVSAYAQEDASAVLTLEPIEVNVSEMLASEAPYFYGIADDAVFSGSSYSTQLDDASLEFYEMILDVYSDGTDLEVHKLDEEHTIENVTITISNNTINIPQTADDQFFAWYKTVYSPALGAVIYDHPELSWLVNSDLLLGASRSIPEYESGVSSQEVTVVYTPTFYFKTNCTDSGTPSDITNAVSKAQTAINAELPTNADRYDTVREIHDYIAENIEYNHDAADGTITDKAQLRLYQTAYSAFYPVGGDSEILTVCAGYAKGFKVLCDSYGIPNILVPGKANGGAHLWNYVKMDDNCWYAVDCTWDDQGQVYYDFFLIGSDEIPEHFSSGKFSSSHVNGDHYAGYTFDYPTLSKNYYERIEGVLINETNFPDANFRTYVADNLDQDANGTLTDEEISAVTRIDVTNQRISSLVGLEYFIKLQSLSCSGNLIENLDLSKNTELTILICENSPLTELDLSKNTKLTRLMCRHNSLTSLDLSNNILIEYAECSSNQINKLNISGCTELTELFCESNELVSLDVSGCTALEQLSCGHNKLTSLNVSKNTSLTNLGCGYNQLTSIDLSKNSVLKTFNCNANEFTSLDVSNNLVLQLLSCVGNQLTDIDLSKNTVLMRLLCSDNRFTSIDLSDNIELLLLYCANNQLTGLDLSNNTKLRWLDCDGNQFTNLDVSKNTALEELNCASNNLTALNVSYNTALINLYCSNNQLTSLDLNKNIALEILECNSNRLTNLDVSKNTTLINLFCCENQLTSLDVSKNTALKWLWCDDNQLTSIDPSNNPALSSLWCSNNQLTSIDISQNPELLYYGLDCDSNSYTLTTSSLNELKPYGFDPAKASNWTGATYDSATNSLKNITADTVTYDYDAGNDNTVTFTLVIDIPEPVAPANIKTTAGDGKVTVAWDAVKGATKYAVYLYDNGVYTCKSSAVTGTSYTVTGLTGGTKYGFKVKSYVNGTWSAASAIVYATPTGASVIPENIKTTAGDSKVTMTWNAVTGATKYAVYMLQNGSYVCKSNAVTGTSYTFTGLTNGTTYNFRVKAYVNGAWKTASAAVSGTPVASASTSVIPENIKTTGGNGTVTMSWNAVTGATKYAVYMLQNGSYVCKSNAVTGTSYTFTGLTNGTQYSFRVKAFVNGAWKAASATVYGTPTASASTSVIPENIKTTGGNGTVTMSWNAVTGATKYAVYMLQNGSYVCKSNAVTGTSYTFTGLTNGTQYSFRVKAFVNGAWKAASATVYGTPKASASTSVIPENIKTTGGNGTVTMSWNAVNGATKYAVYMLENGAYVCKSNAVTGTSYTFTGLTNGTKYSFRVKAFVNGTWKAASATVYGTPKA